MPVITERFPDHANMLRNVSFFFFFFFGGGGGGGGDLLAKSKNHWKCVLPAQRVPLRLGQGQCLTVIIMSWQM